MSIKSRRTLKSCNSTSFGGLGPKISKDELRFISKFYLFIIPKILKSRQRGFGVWGAIVTERRSKSYVLLGRDGRQGGSEGDTEQVGGGKEDTGGRNDKSTEGREEGRKEERRSSVLLALPFFPPCSRVILVLRYEVFLFSLFFSLPSFPYSFGRFLSL
jgi:hypothetical protein